MENGLAVVAMMLSIFFSVVGMHAVIAGTANMNIKCVEYSKSGSCTRRVLVAGKTKYALILIEDK